MEYFERAPLKTAVDVIVISGQIVVLDLAELFWLQRLIAGVDLGCCAGLPSARCWFRGWRGW